VLRPDEPQRVTGQRGMRTVRPCELPPAALLGRYGGGPNFTDCYACDVAVPVSQAAYVEAFYTTPLFRLERTLLAWLAGRASSDADARRLALGSAPSFSAWRVEQRCGDQLLLADMTGRTRSWLMTAPGAAGGTRLYFGSAVLPTTDRASGRPTMGVVFQALLGFHRLYSRLLLSAARARLERGAPGTSPDVA
jgi:hypothetical protein